MTASIATRGMIAPSTAAASSGPSGFIVPFELRDVDGVLTAGVDLSAGGVIQLSKNGAGFANRVGAAPTSIGGGAYYYVPDASEVDTEGFILVKIAIAGYQTSINREEVASPLTQADLSAALTTIGNDITAAQGSIEGNINSTRTTLETGVADSRTDVLAAVAALPDEATIAAAALAAIQSWSHDDGVTFEGLMIRLESFITGKVTGGNVHGRWFKRDGVTVAFEGNVNSTAGTRGAADVSGSES